MDIRTSDGDVHRFTSVDVFLLEDTRGKGHNTQTVGVTDPFLIFAGLDPPR